MTLQVRCDRCAKTEDWQVWTEKDQRRYPPGWANLLEGHDLCPNCKERALEKPSEKADDKATRP